MQRRSECQVCIALHCSLRLACCSACHAVGAARRYAAQARSAPVVHAAQSWRANPASLFPPSLPPLCLQVHFDKITSRISRLCYNLAEFVDPIMVSQKVIQGLYKGQTIHQQQQHTIATASLPANTTTLTPLSYPLSSARTAGVTTSELDELAAETAAHLTALHPDFGVLAARIAISNLHKSTLKSFSETCTLLYNYVEPKTGKQAPMIADDVYEFIQANKDQLDAAIVFDRDFGYDYFGFKVKHNTAAQ